MQAELIGAILVMATLLVAALKKAFPTFMDGKEDLASVVLSVALMVGAKLVGLIQASWLDWVLYVNLALGGGIAGLGSGLMYDKWVKRPSRKVSDKGMRKEDEP